MSSNRKLCVGEFQGWRCGAKKDQIFSCINRFPDKVPQQFQQSLSRRVVILFSGERLTILREKRSGRASQANQRRPDDSRAR
jgi:hypothetical protein